MMLLKGRESDQTGNDYVYYPSEFKIIYKVNKAFSYNQGIALVERL